MIEVTLDNLSEAFQYHAPSPDQRERYSRISRAAEEYARVILENAPRCPLRTRALNNVMDARMVANAAIALEGVQ